MTTDRFDLALPSDLIDRAKVAIGSLDGVVFGAVDDGVAAKRSRVAELSRSLLHLADTLGLAENLIRQQYWAMKGYDDPIAQYEVVEDQQIA